MIPELNLQGLKFKGLEKTMKVNLFANNTTVFLSKKDDTILLFALLEEWCQAVGARFNIDKTMVIPLEPEVRGVQEMDERGMKDQQREQSNSRRNKSHMRRRANKSPKSLLWVLPKIVGSFT
jgi:hypothetical protein